MTNETSSSTSISIWGKNRSNAKTVRTDLHTGHSVIVINVKTRTVLYINRINLSIILNFWL